MKSKHKKCKSLKHIRKALINEDLLKQLGSIQKHKYTNYSNVHVMLINICLFKI